MAEMVTYLPISSPFIRFAGRYVDEAFGFAAGWNFFVFEAAMVPFEITACNVIIHYWSDAVPAGGIIAITIVLYGYVVIHPHPPFPLSTPDPVTQLPPPTASSTSSPSNGTAKWSSGPPSAKCCSSSPYSSSPSWSC